MRLQIHRNHFGVDSDGQWWQRVQGEWVAIERPAWSKTKPNKDKVVNLDELRMAEPEGFVRQTTEMQMVTVYKVTEKTVPDYEAELLCRNGWTKHYPGSLRHYQEDSKQLSIETV